MQIRFIRMIDDLFRGVPHSRKVLELKEEMVQNLMDKYKDLIAQGKSEEAAFEIAAASIGDIGDLVRELRKDDPFYADEDDESVVIHGTEPAPTYEDVNVPPTPEQTRQRSASITATAVMLFILSPTPLMMFRSGMGRLLMLVMIAAGIGLLVFNGLMKPGRTASPVQTILDTDRTEEDRKKLYSSISSAFWLIVVTLYILISFQTGYWHVSWVIFLFAAAVENLLEIVFKPNPKKFYGRVTGAMVTSSVAFFFIISFATGAWHVSWVIILLGVALSNLLKAFLQIKERR